MTDWQRALQEQQWILVHVAIAHRRVVSAPLHLTFISSMRC